VGPSFGPSCITSIHIWEWHFWGSEASVPFLIIQFNQEFAPNIEPAFEAISNDFSSIPGTARARFDRNARRPVLHLTYDTCNVTN
jgi:hypothetical protein